MRNRILLIDNSAVLHILKHAYDHKRLKKNEQSTYIIFNFLFRLQFLIRKVRPTVCVFARDSHTAKSKRRIIYPDYKIKRQKEKKPEQIALDNIAYPQFTEVEEKVLPNLGFTNIFKVPGLEADDVIASVCKSNPSSEIIIVTTDEDMYQLLTNTVCILNAKRIKYFTKQDFIKKYGIQPNDWKKVKAVAGCKTDEVPGIPGIGEKTIIKYLRNELPPHHKTYQKIKDKQYFDLITRNKKLVILPFEGTPSFEVDFMNRPTAKGIKKVGKLYNFLPIKKDFNHWCKTLRGF
jgi:DNA polymerase-1